jgi:riboflavin kinase/FMN adenylyltransferase
MRVSSSLIRKSILEGRVSDAARFMGRPFALSGLVVGGQKLGRKLGYPTANLARSFDQVVPEIGIYAGWVTSPRGRYMASISVGVRPAVGGGDRTIEAYLLDYPGDSLYGMGIEIEFAHRLRNEQNFSSLEELITQIGLDVEKTRELLLKPSVLAS